MIAVDKKLDLARSCSPQKLHIKNCTEKNRVHTI